MASPSGSVKSAPPSVRPRSDNDQQIAQRRALKSGIALALSPLAFAVAGWTNTPFIMIPFSWTILVAWFSGTSLAIGAILLLRHAAAGRMLISAGIVALPALAIEALVASPLLTLLILLFVTGLLAFLWGPRFESGAIPALDAPVHTSRLRGATLTASALWAFSGIAVEEHQPWELVAIAASFGVVALLTVDWILRCGRHAVLRAVVMTMSLIAAGATVSWLWSDWWPSLSSGMIVTVAVSLLLPRASTDIDPRSWDFLLAHPARLLIGTFASLCVVGTFLLALPQSAADGHSIDLLDAAFTAVSAVCVTGLTVLDTPVDFAPLGQVFILILIQLGGLGIMTFSTAAIRLLGGRMNMRHESAISGLLSSHDRERIYEATSRIVVFAFSAELIGAGLLTWAFRMHGDGWGMATWRGIFTSVSAFCNAGFAIQSDNLVAYQSSPIVLHVVGGLIILGGLSPVAALALPVWLARRGRGKPVSVQSKLALLTTAALLGLGCVMILAFEWDNTLGPLSFVDRLHNAWFQSVTLRTAGFNSIDVTLIKPATLTMMLVWMFIGGSPGGTAGGIRTTTAAVLFLTVMHAVRGHRSVTVFNRTLSSATIYKAAVITFLGFTGVVIGVLAVLLTQTMPARSAVFEVISALGTVGLSVGGTTQLDGVGKVIISACMFVGRVGMLTLLMIASQRRPPVVLHRPEVEVGVG